jgi:hypothetical protein
MSISSSNLKKLLIPLLVAVASVPAADIAYRLAGARPSDNLVGLYTSFGENGFRLQENVVTSTEWFSGPFTVITDDLGLRCGSSPATRTRPGATVDFLVLGDSQGYGQCLSFPATIVGALTDLATGEGKRIANCSVGGHYLRNQLELAQWLHEEKELDIQNVLVLLTPYLVATSRGYNQAKVSSDGLLYRSKPSLPARIAVWAKTNTTIFGRVRNMVRNLVGVENDNSMLFSFFATGDPYQKRELALLETLREIREWADSIGASLRIVYTPLAAELDGGNIEALAKLKNLDIDVDVPIRQTRHVAEELSLPVLSLRPVLFERLSSGEELTCRGDPHYNEETSVACARSIWSFLGTTTAD